MTIVEFLTARLNEEAAAAKAATGTRWRADDETYPGAIEGEDGQDIVSGMQWGTEGVFRNAADAAHIALHDPARVLREIEAGRRLLAIHQQAGKSCTACDYQAFPCSTLRVAAMVHADHEDYLTEWAPPAWEELGYPERGTP